MFNATSKSSSSVSLNDILMVGPRIQQELFPIFFIFRFYPVFVIADIIKCSDRYWLTKRIETSKEYFGGTVHMLFKNFDLRLSSMALPLPPIWQFALYINLLMMSKIVIL